MSLVYSEIGGLTVATSQADEQSVRRAIKQIDSRYMLDCVPIDHGVRDGNSRLAWVVLCRIGSAVPPMVVTNWLDDHGNPLPLSHGLVEKVKRLRLDGRGEFGDAMAANDRLRERNKADFEEAIDDAVRTRLKHKGQWRYFFGDSKLDPLKIRASRMKAQRADQ